MRGDYLKLFEVAAARGLRVELEAERGRLTRVGVCPKGAKAGMKASRRVVRSLDYAAGRLLDDLGA
jgi:hypothetical protein